MARSLSDIKMLAMDVDGTLTDGGITFVNGHQIKIFNVYDGLGIRVAITNGVRIVWITGNKTSSVSDRATSLGIDDVFQGARLKSAALTEVAAKYGLALAEIAYIGDDLNDIPAFEKAGYCFAVANACEELKALADEVTVKEGGKGAVREAIETIFKAQNRWEEAVASFMNELAKEQAEQSGPEAVG